MPEVGYWKNITYLKNGNTRQKQAYQVLTEIDILNILIEFDPILIGTIPIGIDIPGSDLDIICNACADGNIQQVVKGNFSSCKGFSDRIDTARQAYVANFIYSGMELEIYAQSCPTYLQNGYRHMDIEYRILQLAGKEFRQKIISLKQNGLKTEPAFGKLLQLENPYEDLLSLEFLSDIVLSKLIKSTNNL